MTDEDNKPRDSHRNSELLGASRAANTPEAARAQNKRTTTVAALLSEPCGLTLREAEVLSLVIKGRSIACVQENLHISQGTVGTHTRHIYQKAGTCNRQAFWIWWKSWRRRARSRARDSAWTKRTSVCPTPKAPSGASGTAKRLVDHGRRTQTAPQGSH